MIPSYEYHRLGRETRREPDKQQLFVTNKRGVTSVKKTPFLLVVEKSHIQLHGRVTPPHSSETNMEAN